MSEDGKSTKNDTTNADGIIVSRNMMELQDLRRAYLNIVEDLEIKNKEIDEEKAYAVNILNSILEMLFVLELDGTISIVNTAVSTLLGYKKDELIGKKIDLIFNKEVCKIFSADGGFDFFEGLEATVTTKGGDAIHTLCSYSIVKKQNNKPQGVLCARDISDRKKMEDEIKENLKETTLNLVQSEKLNALGELTASIAHELKQPLNIIRIISQSLEMDIKKNRLKDEELKNGLVDIKKQIDKMSEVIEHMRIFTRRTGTLMEEKNVNTVVETACKFFYQQLQSNNVELIIKLEDNLPDVLIDAIQIEQVLINLISNAKDAFESNNTKEAKNEIKTYTVYNVDNVGNIDSNKSLAGKKLVVLEITDNAAGIPDEIVKKIFDPFFTTKAPGKGTGLGLSISKKIIENHHGNISLKTKINEGSHFIISLPPSID
ncbi:MAG: PAS domain S-box protein [Oligoflexia bacterium]|nr:PAS domain S-box protein [Oligoflexia bacterium]